MRRVLILLLLAWVETARPAPLRAETNSPESDAVADDDLSLKQRLIDKLPPAMGDGLDIDAWGWAGILQTNYENNRYYDAEVGLGFTKSFYQHMAIGGEGNYIDANGETRFELEQGYASIKLSDATQTLLTVGKFNADIGTEQRDFWNRTTATTSLLFAAKPQDLLGVMLTQPIGETGLRIRSFITEGFESAYDFNQSPSAGITAEFKPNRQIEFALTNWVGPGFVEYGGRNIQQPFPQAYVGYDGDPGSAVIENWQGPDLDATRASTLYLVDASCIIRPVTDLSLTGEFLFGRTGAGEDGTSWGGFMLMSNYDLTDQLHLYGRWSYLDDSDGLITGLNQRCQELSVGAGYQIIEGWELRGEYRHDFSNATADFDTVTADLTFTY